ncbi:helix-turn-helix protein [Hydrogenoanaerobacterium saccharovorans]|uniref:Helix-turn-helix n=1 Tax=Hydrogenoanaerobacterium saccharovorans TaxID=474960 RepID=A0A1H8BF70_9FIRM|nr:helix-turn-helix transcriptional regulator [Hydrogenoanaerobacterium saccharovorans]RPF47439.1 helix-turn-helix protein [Hydrogenoanaerobacterium saccharovorans]SEM81505.1 Helix-turn-helix [Hydrogenoanaerobacterium saccharovorans]
MYKNKAVDGRNNICGKNVARIRKSLNPKVSQRMLADQLQIQGLDVDKNAIQRIENGERFVTDIELVALANILNVSLELLTNAKH